MRIIKYFSLLESKRISLPSEIDNKLIEITDKLWKQRGLYTSKRKVDNILFNTLDGASGMVRLFVDPDLDTWGTTDTYPLYSRDPMDFIIVICKITDFENKEHLYNVLYHEMIHVVDPTQSTKFSGRFQSTYKWWQGGKDYYSHKIEQTAIFNELLNSLVKAFQIAENKDIKLLDSVLKFFMDPRLDKRKINQRTKSLIDLLGRERGIIILKDVIKWDKRSYRDFLKKIYSTYLEIKQSF